MQRQRLQVLETMPPCPCTMPFGSPWCPTRRAPTTDWFARHYNQIPAAPTSAVNCRPANRAGELSIVVKVRAQKTVLFSVGI
jgi:hypothetical protein